MSIDAAPGSSARLRDPALDDALIPLITLAVLIAGALALLGLDALDAPIQVALVLCCAVAASVTSAIFILLAVGALIGVELLRGVHGRDPRRVHAAVVPYAVFCMPARC